MRLRFPFEEHPTSTRPKMRLVVGTTPLLASADCVLTIQQETVIMQTSRMRYWAHKAAKEESGMAG